MRLRPLAMFLAPAATACLVAACDDKDDDDDDDPNNCGDDALQLGGRLWRGDGRGCDSGTWDGDTGGWGRWDSGSHSRDEIDSCSWPGIDICFEFEDYGRTASWCADIGDVYGIDTDYDGGSCDGGSIFECDVTHVGGDIPSGADRVTAHYYEPSFTTSAAESACEDVGGSPT